MFSGGSGPETECYLASRIRASRVMASNERFWRKCREGRMSGCQGQEPAEYQHEQRACADSDEAGDTHQPVTKGHQSELN